MGRSEAAEFSELQGKTLVKVERVGDEVLQFYTKDGWLFEQYHDQDCCESVRVEDICGDLEDLVGHPILVALEVSQRDPNADESGTWTFYKLATVKGWVDIRWYGASNGYYSESVDLRKMLVDIDDDEDEAA